jgi:hypothetical protein
MRLDRSLNLVLPLETDNGTVYVHSTPVSRDTFERHYLVVSKTFAAMYQEGLAALAGPRVAAMLLRDVAMNTRGQNGSPNAWEGSDGVELGLMAEIRRLTNLVMPSEKGWETIPFQDAISRKLLSPDDIADAESVIVFFICASAMHRRATLEAFLTGAASLWGAQITSSTSTGYAASLPTSIETASSGEKAETARI